MQVLNNSPSAGYIAWSDAKISYKGVINSVADGNTNLSYVYWKYSDPTTFYGSNNFPVLGPDDLMVFLNKNGTYLLVPNATIIEGSLIVPESILANAISANAVTAEKIMAGAINADKLSANSVGANAIAANVVAATHMVAGTITAISGILADAVITSAKIANLAVGNAAIANLAVTNGKIGLLAVGTAQIADATITNAKIANLAVDAAKIADLAVTNAKIANATITSAKIVSLNADKIVAISLSAISANLGTVTAGTINGVTIISGRPEAHDTWLELKSGTLTAFADGAPVGDTDYAGHLKYTPAWSSELSRSGVDWELTTRYGNININTQNFFRGDINIVSAKSLTLSALDKVEIVGSLVVGNIIQASWGAVSFLNNWKNYGGTFSTARYFKDKNGIVHLTGLINGGAGGATAFTLPTGYRPDSNMLAFGLYANNGLSKIELMIDGRVIPTQSAGAYWISLEGISFRPA